MPRKSNKKRADGRFAVQVYVGTVDGKRKYKTAYGSTQKEADANAELIKLKLNKGMDIINDSMPFSSWADKWLSTKKKTVGESQGASYELHTAKLNEYIGNISLKDIKTIHIQKIIDDYAEENPHTGKPSSKRLLEVIKTTANQIFKMAIENRILDYNPAEYVRIPKSAPKEQRRALTENEQQLIINAPDHQMKPMAMIMLLAGLRRGEAVALRWDDIDFDNETITVNKAVEFVDKKPIIKETKTKAGTRIVYMQNILSEYLRSLPKKSNIVCHFKGEMFTLDQFRHSWESFITTIDALSQGISKFSPNFKHQLDNITPHMLRHTFATNMYLCGIDVLTAKEQIGHSNIETTLQIYTHITQSHAKEQMQKLNNASQMQVKIAP